MFKTNYYYIVAGLADLIPNQEKLTMSLLEFKENMKEHLKVSDYLLLEKIFLNIDNQNILNNLQKNTAHSSKTNFLNGGKYSQDEIELKIKDLSFDEEYINRFVSAFQAETAIFDNGLSWEDQLASLYFDMMINHENEFLSSYFEFDMNVNNIVTALNSRRFEIADKNVFVGQNSVSEALKQSSLKDFGLSSEFPMIEKLVSIFEESNMVRRETAIDKIKWDFLDDLNTFNYFTIEVILAHVIKLRMLERWMLLDAKTGKQLFAQLVSDLNSSFRFSKEFEIIKRNS